MKYSKETNKLIQDIGLDKKNTGSSEAQIALLTDRIRSLTEHVKDNKKMFILDMVWLNLCHKEKNN